MSYSNIAIIQVIYLFVYLFGCMIKKKRKLLL